MALAHAALTLVRDRERHAYEIATLLSRLVPGPRYNPGQIHATMTQLEDRGHVTSRWASTGGRRRRLYGITAAGRREWERWRARPLPEPKPHRDEIIVKTMVLGLDEPHLLRAVLEDHRERLVQWLERFDEGAIDPAACESRTELLHALARLLVCLRQQAELRWTERCLEELVTLTAMPPSPAVPPTAPAGRGSSPARARPDAPAQASIP